MVYVIGNGPSLLNVDFSKLTGRTYAVNRIWKLWKNNKDFTWRPTDYVRCEKPRIDARATDEDLREMSRVHGLIFHLEDRLSESWRRAYVRGISTHNYHFYPCAGKEAHDWHLPQICGYGTIVTTAIQVAVKDGASEICLLGCDLTMPQHFYEAEGFDRNELALRAHEIAARCSPVPIYNCTVGGNLNVYERKELQWLKRN